MGILDRNAAQVPPETAMLGWVLICLVSSALAFIAGAVLF